MELILTVKTEDYEMHKQIIQSLGGEILSTKLEQIGFCDNSNLITFCKVPKKSQKLFKKYLTNLKMYAII